MSVEDFGITNSLQILSSILIIVITLALDRSLVRLYYDYSSEKDRRDYLGTVFISLVSFGLIGTSICLVSKTLLNKLFPSIPFYPYFTYTILYTFILLVINYAQMIAQVKQNSKQFMFISLSTVIVAATCNLAYVVYYNEGALGFVKGTFWSGVLIIPIALLYIHKSINYKFNLEKLKTSLIFSLPVLPSLLSSWILNLSDRVIITKYFSLSDVGIYSLGYKLASLILFISAAFFMAYNPIFFDIANKVELTIEEKKNKLYKINSGVTLVIGIIGLCILSGSDIILKLFFKKEYLVSYHYISIFALSFIISQIGAFYNLMVYQNKKTQHVAIVIVLTAGLNILLNTILIPNFGVYFAAITNLICSAVNFTCMYFLAKKNFFIKTDWKILILIIAVYFIVYIENIFLLDQNLLFSILVKLGTVAVILLILKKTIINVIKTLKNK